MRLSILSLLLLVGCVLAAKSVTKALTESLGQEVIEIGAPLKELPGDLEEEPSMEKEDVDARASPASKVPLKKPVAPVASTKRKLKDIDRIDAVNQEDDEQRVEKELADIYRDNDYKADSNELKTNEESDPLRQGKKTDFVFAPNDINNPKQVEKFRTSPDYIDCKKKKLVASTDAPGAASSSRISMAVLGILALGVYYS